MAFELNTLTGEMPILLKLNSYVSKTFELKVVEL